MASLGFRITSLWHVLNPISRQEKRARTETSADGLSVLTGAYVATLNRQDKGDDEATPRPLHMISYVVVEWMERALLH